MSESFLQQLFADRIGGEYFGRVEGIYKFAKIKEAKRVALKRNPNRAIIDLGIGEPDTGTHFDVINRLARTASEKECRGYADNGPDFFKEGVSHYMKKTYGVEVDPQREVMHSMGSKAALSILPK